MDLKNEFDTDELPTKIHTRFLLLVQSKFREWRTDDNGKSKSLFISFTWFVVFVGEFAAGSYFSIKSIIHYLEFGTTTSINIVQFDS
jgi:hypothetical protein